MKFSVLFLLVAYLLMPGQSASVAPSGCLPNEYNPGPNCGTEPTCAPPSSHFWPKHTCDCWCRPGLYRDIDTNQCVKKCSMHPSVNEIMYPCPNCGTDPTCAPPSSHFWPKHACDCCADLASIMTSTPTNA